MESGVSQLELLPNSLSGNPMSDRNKMSCLEKAVRFHGLKARAKDRVFNYRNEGCEEREVRNTFSNSGVGVHRQGGLCDTMAASLLVFPPWLVSTAPIVW